MTEVLRPLLGGRPAVVWQPGPLPSPCLVWQGCVNSKGYPVRGTKKERFLVHRRVFELAHGPIDAGCEVHHVCEVRRCVNVAHLRAVLPLDHRHEHTGELVRLLRQALHEGDQTMRELTRRCVAAGFVSPSPSLWRMIRRGEVRRVRRGVYTLAAGLPVVDVETHA